MEIVTPVMDGIIVDWDLYEKLWTYSLENRLKTDIAEKPVLLAEKPFIAPSARHKYVDFSFPRISV